MAPWPIFDNALIAGWAHLMIGALWQGSLLLLFIWSIIRLFPRIDPAIQCWLWRLVFLKFLIAFLWLKPLKLYLHIQIALWKLGWLLANSHTTRHYAKMTQSALKANLPIPVSFGGVKFWFVLWVAGLLLSMIVLLYIWRRQRTICHRCFPIRDPFIVSCYHELGRRNNFRKMPQLFAADGIHSPLLQGIIHPKIILPTSILTDFKSDELQIILAHELAHYQRGDLFWNWLPVITHSVFFFLPFVWRIEKKLIQAQEICCDRLAVQLTKAPATFFGDILFRVSIRPGRDKRNGFTLYYGSQSIALLKERLRALQSINPINRHWMVMTTCLILTVGIAVLFPCKFVLAYPLPVNLWINYPSPGKFEISAHVLLPEKQIKTAMVLIDDKPLPTTYHVGDVYFGYAEPHENNFPQIGMHKVTVKALTDTGPIIEHNWIYFQDGLSWGSHFIGDPTVLKIGPFFWIVNSRYVDMSGSV